MKPLNKPTPSPEVKALLREFCEIQRAKYGENWKEILSKEMAKNTTDALKRAGIIK